MRNIAAVLLCLLAAIHCGDATAQAVPAVQTSSGFSAAWRDVIGANQSATVGWSFSVGAQTLQVEALGIYDDGANGMQNAHQVGIWTAAGTLLAQTTVPAATAAALVGSYRYVTITPITLSAGKTYVVGTMFAPVVDRCGSACGDVLLALGTQSYDSRIRFLQSRQTRAVIGAGTLTFPNVDAEIAEGIFGPNVLFSTSTPVRLQSFDVE